MSSEGAKITKKQVADLIVAGIRFAGAEDDIPEVIGRLLHLVNKRVTGGALVLFHRRDRSGPFDIEVCFPVSEKVDLPGVTCRTLRGGLMLAIRHRIGGPDGCSPESLAAARHAIRAFMVERDLVSGSGPRRELYIEHDAGRAFDPCRCVVEIQIPLRFNRIEALADSLQHHAGGGVRRQVMDGSEHHTDDTDPADKAAWIRAAMHRLDALVPNETRRANIIAGSACRFPKERIELLQAMFLKSGKVDDLLTFMQQDHTAHGHSLYGRVERQGDAILIEPQPRDPAAYAAAIDPAAKQRAFCHCPWGRAVLDTGKRMSVTHCLCGAGWYQQLWEGIFLVPVEVQVVQSIMNGDDACQFSVVLPPGL